MRLHDFTNEIFDIAEANGNVRYDVGVDMFLNNIDDSGKLEDRHFYFGADNINYIELKAMLAELRASKNDFVKVVKQNLLEIATLRANGKRDKAKQLVCNYK